MIGLTWTGALALARSLVGVVGGLKVGLEFVTANGPDGVRQIGALGLPVFLDVKFHDIPNTVAGAVAAAHALGVAMLTLHVCGGGDMLRAAVETARCREPHMKLIGVTVLTSLDDADLSVLGIADKVTAQVLRLAELAWDAGLDGIVCAPHELPLLRSRFEPGFSLVVPGIRPAGSAVRRSEAHQDPRRSRGGRSRCPGDRAADHRGERSGGDGARDQRRDRPGPGRVNHAGRGQDLRPQ